MNVTLDIFSGRPNPTWTLSEAEAKQLLDRVGDRAVLPSDAVEPILGFRGFVIEPSSDDQPLSSQATGLRIGGRPSAGFKLESRAKPLTDEETAETVRWLLSTGEHATGDLHEILSATVLKALQQHAPSEEAEVQKIPLRIPPPPCVIHNTPYNPGFWNRPNVQPYNNCYNYAMNYKSDTFAQPGRLSGHMYASIDCQSVGAAAAWDGCKTTCFGSNKLVALVIWPHVDFHWYRRHSEGFWGHKPGGTAARNTDNRGRLIDGSVLTPANCDRGGYTIFCGYRFSPTGMHVS